MHNFYPPDYLKSNIDFINLKIKVPPGVFIPREETEEFLKLILKKKAKLKQLLQSMLLVDMCTGTGIWGLILTKLFSKTILVDYSKTALKASEENIKLNSLSGITIIESKLFKSEKLRKNIQHNKNWILVCNPPYVPNIDKLYAVENRVNYEPKEAIYSGKDGLFLFKRILSQIVNFNLKFPKLCIFELDPRNINKAKHLLKKYYLKVHIYKDVYRRSRFLIGYLTK